MRRGIIKVKMRRGGMMNLEAEGRVYEDETETGERFTACEDFALHWPGGGYVAEKNVADIQQAINDFVRATRYD